MDVCENGLRLELPVPIPPRAEISLNAERIKMSGSARVRHATRRGSKYVIGVELSQTVKSTAFAAALAPQSAQVPVIV